MNKNNDNSITTEVTVTGWDNLPIVFVWEIVSKGNTRLALGWVTLGELIIIIK